MAFRRGGGAGGGPWNNGAVRARGSPGDRAMAERQGTRDTRRHARRGVPRAAEVEPRGGAFGYPGHHARRDSVRVHARFLWNRHFPAADHQGLWPLEPRIGMLWWSWHVDRTGKKI